MRIIAIFFLIVGLYGCKAAPEHDQTPVLLSYSTLEQSKTDLLTEEDAIGVFACIAGTEGYFAENTKYIVGSDGRSLSTSPAVYYPDRKQAVAFTAYLPFGGTWSGAVGTFAVPTDQSTAAELKQADLCWATASSTPAKTAVPLQFEHKLARLLITANQTPTKIVAPNVFSGGRLDIKTGVFTNTIQSTITTTGTELILPAQTVTRLILTVSGVEYVFEGVISLEAAKTTSINLTLNPSTKTATFAGVTTTAWGAANKSDAASRTVSNQFTAYWLVADYRFNQINKIGLTVKDETSGATKDYTVSDLQLVGGSTIASASYTFALANVPELHYPYTVSALKFYKDAALVHSASVGHVVARTGGATLGSGQNIALTISAATASVTAQVTSSAFTLTSNVPYGSTYTTGGASVQGSGTEPPYASRSIAFTYPAQGATAAAARTHVMTITPTVDYTGAPNKRTFTVTQAAVPTALTLSAAAPDATVPHAGKTYTINVTANSSWKSQSAVNGVTTVPASGTGSVTGVKVVVPASALTTTRTVSIDFITTAAQSGVSETTKKWSGTQESGGPNPTDYVKVGNVYWATGNLVADGANGCKIGAPADGGLYFQFGSLVGWSGGSSGNGVGVTNTSLSVDKAVWPLAMGTTKPSFAWPSNYGSAVGDRTTVVGQYFFNYNVAPYSTTSQDIRGFKLPFTGDAGSGDLGSGRYAKWGVGDPCSYYLGGTWRLPTGAEYAAMCNNKTVIGQSYSWVDAGGTWVPGSGGNLQGTKLFFPASGNRYHSNGSFGYVTTYGDYWSSSVGNATDGLRLTFYSSWVYPQNSYGRSFGFPVRCVSSVP